MDVDFGAKDERAWRELCALSCQGPAGVAYYWSLIHNRFENAVGFRGFSAAFVGATTAREVMDFTVQGPLISCLADLQDVTQLQAIEMSGSMMASAPTEVPFDVKIHVAPDPHTAAGSHNPRGVILRIRNETESTTTATVADLHRHEDWVFVILVAAIAAIAVNSGPALIDVLMYDSSSGDVNVTITTPIGTVTVNKPFTGVAGLAAGIF